jgi:hypothetical protein
MQISGSQSIRIAVRKEEKRQHSLEERKRNICQFNSQDSKFKKLTTKKGQSRVVQPQQLILSREKHRWSKDYCHVWPSATAIPGQRRVLLDQRAEEPKC